MNYKKIHKRLDQILEYENDDFITKIKIDPLISTKLKDYQIFHLFNLITNVNNNRVVLDGSDTGTGKTYTAMALCKQMGLKPFVVCPKSIIPIWKEVALYFDVDTLAIVNYETIKKGKYYKNDVRQICEYLDIDPYRWKLPRNAILIYDEAHRCKSHKTENGKLLISSLTAPKVLMLSATISDKPNNFNVYGLMLGFYKSLRQANNWIKGMILEDKNYIGTNKRNSSINRNIYPNKGSRMTIQDIGAKFPSNQISALCFQIGKKELAEVNEIMRRIKEKSYLINSDTNVQSNILVEIMHLREKLEKFKIKIFEELITDYLEQEYNVVVFVNFKNTLQSLAKKFNTTCIVDGDTKSETATANIKLFQENKTNLILLTLQSGGEGISLHDEHGKPRISLISPSYSAIQLKQALGRIHRIGAKTVCLQKLIFIAGTIEETVRNVLKDKLNFIDSINDEDLAI